MKSFLNWFRNTACPRPAQRQRPGRKTFQPLLEALEVRDMPAILFQPRFGSEVRLTENDYGDHFTGPVLSNTAVHLIFEGDYWQHPNGITSKDVTDRVTNILSSSYLSGLTQYGSNGHAFLAGVTFDNSLTFIPNINVPGGTLFIDNDLEAISQHYMSEQLVLPADRGLYLVVTPPGARSVDQPLGVVGYHSETTTLDVLQEQVPYGWVSTGTADGTRSEQGDAFSATFSHELVESMSDPYPATQPGVTVLKGAQFQDDQAFEEIADFEPDGSRYTYRLATGTLVQAYWSGKDGAFLVPDGTSQVFSLLPRYERNPITGLLYQDPFSGTYDLTVNGDQLLNKNDKITIDTVKAATGEDRIRVTLNGEVATFDPYRISSIRVNTGAGNDTVNVERLPYGTTLTINLGSGTDAVNFSPVARQMDNVEGLVSIHGGTGTSTVTVNDSGTIDQNSTRHFVNYTLSEGDLKRTDLVTSPGNNTSYYPTEILFDGVSKVEVYGGSSGNTFDVQPEGLVTPVVLHGKAGIDALFFNDQDNANTARTVYTVTSGSITRVGTDYLLAPGRGLLITDDTARVYYDSIDEVFVNGGTSGNQFNVSSVADKSALVLSTGPNVNTVQIGDGFDSLDAIKGNVAIVGSGTDTVILNDRPEESTDSFGNDVSFTVTASEVDRTNTMTTHFVDSLGEVRTTSTLTTTFSYSGVASLTLEGGTSGNSFDVQSTQEDTDLSIYAGSGDDYITVGDLGNNLEGLAGPVHVFGEAGSNRLTVYDRAASPEGISAGANSFTIASQSVRHSVEITGSYFGATITKTVAATVSYSDIAALGVYGGAGDDQFAVEALPEAPLTLDGGGGVNTLDYSAYPGDVVVDLPLGTATGFAAIRNIQNVTGSAGNGILVGDANPNVLVGGTGRNLIIGGAEADLVQGGGDDNILIPGTTAYDTDPAALQAILQEWTRTDLGFGDRVNELSSGAFAEPLTLDTVFADLGNDVLVRGPGQDWLAPAALTTISVQSSGPAVEFSAAVTLTATVAGVNPDLGTPTGSVTFFDNGIVIGTAGLDDNGQASITTTGLGVGDHVITASYDGEGNFQGGTSDSFTLTVTPAATQSTIATDASPAVLGQAITLTATVSGSAPGLSTPTGTVTFMEGDAVLGIATLANGVAALQTSGLGLGSHSITAVYASDDGNFDGSTATLTQQVVQASQAKVSSSLATSTFGQSITLTARISALVAGAATPTGTVTFLDGGVVLGSRSLTGGSATLATSALAAGSHAITVFYSGDSAFGASTSTILTQKVNGATTRTTVTSSLATGVFGQPITLKATVAVVAPGAGTATGTVMFKDGTKVLGSIALTGGVASLSVATLAPGTHTITAVFVSATGNFAGSTSPGLSQSTKQAATKTSLKGPATAVTFGQTVTLTAQVTVVAPGAGTPTGTVTFKEGSTVLGTGTLVNGIATFQTRTLGKGSHTITAVYGGDTNMVTSISPGLVVTIR